MLILNLQNIEELVFQDKELKQKIPELTHEFQQWTLGVQVPSLRFLGKQAVIDALSKLIDYKHILERHFEEIVVVEPVDGHTVKNLLLSTKDVESELCKIDGFPNLSISRTDDKLYISIWR